MSGHRFTTVVILLLLPAVTGCLGPRRDDYQSSRGVAIADPSALADTVWEAAQDTLRRHRYRLDRIDRRAGVITTMPETSQTLFEFWRRDVDTWPDLLEATLNPLRRRAEVRVTRGDDGAWSEIAVVVHKERFSSPDRMFNSTGAAYQYFGSNLPSTTGIDQLTTEHDVWLGEGRDPAMEEHLLRAIFERSGLDSDSASSPGRG